MKSKLFLLAGLCAGLALVATAVPADEPAVSADSMAAFSSIPFNVEICHYPPGKNSTGSDRSRTGKVKIIKTDICDFADLCEETDADDDRSQAAQTQQQGDVLSVDAANGSFGCDICSESAQAYDAEVRGHLNNHEGDCWDFEISDCGELEPGGIDGQCESVGDDDDDDDR